MQKLWSLVWTSLDQDSTFKSSQVVSLGQEGDRNTLYSCETCGTSLARSPNTVFFNKELDLFGFYHRFYFPTSGRTPQRWIFLLNSEIKHIWIFPWISVNFRVGGKKKASAIHSNSERKHFKEEKCYFSTIYYKTGWFSRRRRGQPAFFCITSPAHYPHVFIPLQRLNGCLFRGLGAPATLQTSWIFPFLSSEEPLHIQPLIYILSPSSLLMNTQLFPPSRESNLLPYTPWGQFIRYTCAANAIEYGCPDH